MLPNTDGELLFLQGRNLEFTVSLLDDATGQPQVAAGYELAMQIRATIGSDVVILDCGDYATSDPAALTAEVEVPAGVTGAVAMTVDEVEWIADAKFVLTGSDPVEAIDAGRFTVRAFREVTRS